VFAQSPPVDIQYDLSKQSCNGTQVPPTIAAFLVQVVDEDSAQSLSVTLKWSLAPQGVSGSINMTPRDLIKKTFYGQFGPFEAGPNGAAGGTVTVSIVATDHLGLSSAALATKVTLDACRPIIIG
jgi:hypothetical protein